MTWNEDGILELIANSLEHQSSEFDGEQAVQGIDGLTENELRDRMRESLIAADIQAVQEERYPDAKYIERRNYGHRCDLVLLPSDTPSDLKGDPDWCAAGYWLEIKRVSQFLESGPNWWYEHALLEAIPQDTTNSPRIQKSFTQAFSWFYSAQITGREATISRYGSSAPLRKDALWVFREYTSSALPTASEMSVLLLRFFRFAGCSYQTAPLDQGA